MCVCAREYSWTHTLSHRHVLTRAVWERGDGSGTSFSEEANSVNTGLKWNLRPLSDGRGKSVWACLMRPWSVWDIVRVYETHHICMSSRAGGLGLACAGRFFSGGTASPVWRRLLFVVPVIVLSFKEHTNYFYHREKVLSKWPRFFQFYSNHKVIRLEMIKTHNLIF